MVEISTKITGASQIREERAAVGLVSAAHFSVILFACGSISVSFDPGGDGP